MSLLTVNMLVADTSRIIHQIFRGIVARSTLPIDLIACRDGAHCAALMARGGIDVAFIEVDLPGMSGMEALRRARAEGVNTLTALMALKAAMPSLDRARGLNVCEFLEKPFALADVEAVIGSYRRLSAPMTALIVDDSSTARQVIRKVLAGSVFHISIEQAADGTAALVACAAQRFDLVFLDCNMPGLDGFETLRELRERNRSAQVIMMSGERSEQVVRRAAELGASAFLHKPFFPADIDRALHAAFGLRVPRLHAAKQEQRPESGYAVLVTRRAKLSTGVA